MGKTAFIFALICYAGAFVFIYAGLQLAPDMTWPETDSEVLAALMVTAGMGAKLLGHVFLFSTSRARVRH